MCISYQGKAEQDIHDQVCIGGESKGVVDDNTDHRGARMVFHHKVNRHLEEVKMSVITMTHYVERFQESAIEQRRHHSREKVKQKAFDVLG